MVQVLVSLLPNWETQMELFASSPALCTVVICKINQQMNDSLSLNLSAFQISMSCLKKKSMVLKTTFNTVIHMGQVYVRWWVGLGQTGTSHDSYGYPFLPTLLP